MDKNKVVYICTGCGIGEGLDIDQLSEVATDEYNVPECKQHEFLCGPEGVALIKEDIEGGANTLVLAACSMREKQAEFTFPGCFVERVCLRENVIWSHEETDDYEEEDIQMLAEDYLRMGLAKVEGMKVSEPIEEKLEKTVLVVGGGVAGITAALEAARAGTPAVIVEKENRLGGWASRFHKEFPTLEELKPFAPPELEPMLKEVEENDKVTVYTSHTVEKIAGAPGAYDVALKNGNSSVSLQAGSIVLAVGWRPYDPNKLGHLGYGRLPNVMTSVEFEEMVSKGEGILRPSDGAPVQTVAFIQCAGSRDKEHLPYCSTVCCTATLKQIMYLKEANPEASAFVFYKDVRTPGHHEKIYQGVQKSGASFVRGEIVSVDEGGEGGVLVESTDSLLGENVSVEADLLVLATGMVPNTLDSEVLNLQYRQSKEVPELKYGFPNSHFICFPYETRRTGIYAAGSVRQPMDMISAQEDAAGAAFKAIQVVELAEQGKAMHPRVGDVNPPDFVMQRCTQCKRCTEECPFGALDEDEKGTPLPNPTRCRRCGVCMGACPERIVSYKDYSVAMVGNMIKAINVPDEFEEKPRIIALMCENDALPGLEMSSKMGIKYNPFVRVIPLRCLGSTNLVWVADALAKGIDGIMLMGCKFGDDYQCHFIKGSELCNTRMEKVSETLDRLMLESDRIRFHEINIDEYEKIPQLLDEFFEDINELDPNPYKE